MAEARSTSLSAAQPQAAGDTPPSADAAEPPLDYVTHPWVRPQTVERRAYQVNLAEVASQDPSLVVLPTGMGKTVVGLLVAADRLQKHPGGKVLILAPTKPLVEQHQGYFSETVNFPDDAPVAEDPAARVVLFSGHIAPDKRAELWKDASVIAATPQVIENDLIAHRYDLKDVVLIIYDEAHRSTGDYPYIWIASRYRRDNPRGHRLGLTASPGSQAEKILEVCSSLEFAHMEIRTETDEDVKPYIHELDVSWEKVPLPAALKDVNDALRDVLTQRVHALKRLDVLRGSSGIPSRRELLAVAGELQRRIRSADEPDRTLFDAMSLQAQAMKISHALELAETQGAAALVAYWDRLENESQGRGSSKATAMIVNDDRVRQVIEAARAARLDDPKTDRVIDAVRTELVVADDPRIIVFANYRETCERLVERLGKLPGCKPIRFVGQSSREGDKGLTQKGQRDILQAFREGQHNVLVATSVAEEGLDIPQTDLVIFYEPVPSEIRAIQRRGRTARQRAGRAIVLMYAGTRDEAYHWSARRREQNMRRELRSLRNSVTRGLKNKQQARLDDPPSFGGTKAPPAPSAAPSAPAPPRAEAPALHPPSVAPSPEVAEAEAAPSRLREHVDPRAPILSHFDQPRGKDGRVKVLVDHREARSGVVKALERRGMDITPAQLSVADYALSDRVAVERKSVEDFLSSLVDGRLFQQARQLTAYLRPILIVEGGGLTTSRNLPRSSIFGALAALTTDFGITVLQTQDIQETADLLVSIATREQTETRREAPVRLDKVAMNDTDRRRFIIEGLPSVSAVLARRLLAHFGTVEAVVSAGIEDLMEVEGVGRKTAAEIRRVVSTADGGKSDAS